VYQINLKGYIESENPDELTDSITKLIEEKNSELIGQFVVYQLAPYVDYQKADVTDPQDSDSNI